MSQPSQIFQMHVPNPSGPQCRSESFAIVLRIAAGTRNRPDVDHAPDPVGAQQFDQLFESTRRMAYRENGLFLGLLASCHASRIYHTRVASQRRRRAQDFASVAAPEQR